MGVDVVPPLNTDAPAVVLSLFDTGLGAVRELHRLGVRVYGISVTQSETGRATRECTVIDTVDPDANPEPLCAILNDLYDREKRPMVLFSGGDKFTAFISQHAKELAGKFVFTLPNVAVCQAFADKERQLELVRSLGVNVPRTVGFTREGRYARDALREIRVPAIVKALNTPAWFEHYSAKGFHVTNREELDRILDDVKAKGVDALVQELIPGSLDDMVEVSGFVDKSGVIRAQIVTVKKRSYPRVLGVGASLETTRNEAAERIAKRIIDGAPIRGFFNMELKKHSETGEYEYIETNIRLWQQIVLCQQAGLPIIELGYRDATNQALPEPKFGSEGKRWIDPVLDYYSMVKNPDAKLSDFPTWVREFLTADAMTVFSLRDPMPGVRKLKYGRELLGLASQTVRFLGRTVRRSR